VVSVPRRRGDGVETGELGVVLAGFGSAGTAVDTGGGDEAGASLVDVIKVVGVFTGGGGLLGEPPEIPTKMN
jgi:hypothetical protein